VGDDMAILNNSLLKTTVILFTWWLCEPFKFKLIHGLAPSKTTPERSVVILYNKPPNVITSHKSDDSRSTVYEEIQSMRGFLPSDDNTPTAPSQLDVNFEQATGIRSKLHAIGRLDVDTSGLLLLTNDGRLLHHVTNPNAKTEEHEHYFVSTSTTTTTTAPIINKTYRALIMGCHTEDSLEPIKHGVDIGSNYVTKPVHDFQIIEHPNHKSTIVSITISEGKNRQVRKMFHAIGSGVMKLQRTKIGEYLTLEGVQGK
jgi:16S rRNA U516 pseudouridylate synthase RsuA-like enzyme